MLKMAPIPLLAFFLLTNLVLPSSAQEYRNHSGCEPFRCGKLGQIRFPFNNMTNPECGVVTVNCSEDISKIQFKDGGHWFGIDRITQADVIVVNETVPLSYLNSLDPCKLINDFSFPSSTNSSIFLLINETSSKLYNCSHSLLHTPPQPIDLIRTMCGDYDFYCNPPNTSFPYEQQCQNIMLPFPLPLPPPPPYSIPPSINITFQVQINPVCLGCLSRGGKCDNINVNQVQCIVPQKVVSGLSKKQKLGLELAVAFGGIGTVVVMLIYRFRKKHNHAHQSIEAFLKNCGPLQIRRYSYLNIKKMTNSFKEKLGQGGFGSVYKGKLHDGHLVAVKMLNELKANDGEDFINEVAAISRTSHVNVVRLLGFCFEGAKKALIYEFMPNGSLEKFVYDEDEIEESYQLDWETYYQISLGTARGLEYLHRGCNRRILHFDIKPHNILLDANFMPKISDFGLAKICTRKDSVVSMLGPRGTIGYIAPEVFCRSFGGVSHKSDVYSYGMMVLEMVGGRKNVNIRVANSSELYFLQWIYERLKLKELGLKRIISEEDNVKSRKMIMTSLWCIQTDPSSRPTMSRVIEMLEGSLDSLKVPPKPFLSSPPRSSPFDPYMNMEDHTEGTGSGYLGVLVFSYKQLAKATDNFNAEKILRHGSSGAVYHGKLKDGREVAVKRLYEQNYKRVREQVQNEIEILTRLRHKNLVSLYGCTSRHCQELLLVYKYIPNGTVADHLHGDRVKTSPLTWPIRLSIAIETASALVYLHASDVVHRDVQTNNILLDNNFCVKVSDFGLSRLFPIDVTHVSATPQGTPGYVDPEYFQCYQLTSKSDVYSFGVVLIELLSSMPAIDMTRHRREIYLANLAISKIQTRAYNELIDRDLGFDSNTEVRTMTIAVAELAFECLQQDKEMRPTMDEVLERLRRIKDGKI